MPAKMELSLGAEQAKLLYFVAKHSKSETDYAAVAKEMGLSSVSAAQQRMMRLMKKLEEQADLNGNSNSNGTTSASNNSPNTSDPVKDDSSSAQATTTAKKRRAPRVKKENGTSDNNTKKRKVSKGPKIEENDFDGEEENRDGCGNLVKAEEDGDVI